MKVAYLTYTPELEGSRLKISRLFVEHFAARVFYLQNNRPTGDLIAYAPDLIICHGDWCRHYEIPVLMGIPYILVEHDVQSMRATINYILEHQERMMIERAAGVMFTSEEYPEFLGSKYKLPPFMVMHLRPSEKDLCFEPKKKLDGNHLVYEGGLLQRRAQGGVFGYRVYHEIFEAFLSCGWTVHLYPTTRTNEEQNTSEYEALGCNVYEPLPYGELLKEMSQYTAGLLAHNKCSDMAFEFGRASRPNKIWDYLAAGIPTIAYNQKNSGRMIEEGGWGISLRSLAHIPDLDLPGISPEMRQEQVIEKDIPSLKAFVQARMKT